MFGRVRGSRELDAARLRNVASLSESSSWEFIMSMLSAPAREQPDRGREPRERERETGVERAERQGSSKRKEREGRITSLWI